MLTDEINNSIEALWRDGKTMGEIINHFNGQLTRGQVAGRLYRSGLMRRRREAWVENMKEKKKDTPKTKFNSFNGPRDSLPPAPIVVSKAATKSFSETGPKPLVDIGPNECHWPLGDPKEAGFMMCAGPKLEEGPYCQNHYRISRVQR